MSVDDAGFSVRDEKPRIPSGNPGPENIGCLIGSGRGTTPSLDRGRGHKFPMYEIRDRQTG